MVLGVGVRLLSAARTGAFLNVVVRVVAPSSGGFKKAAILAAVKRLCLVRLSGGHPACRGWPAGYNLVVSNEVSSIPKQRPSASADAALLAEIERVRLMTVEERVREALSLKDRLSWFSAERRKERDQ